MTSIKDVADAAGVSTATVSRVLADKPHVRPEIRDRVLTVVKALNYRPNRVARSLRVQKSNIIGLIVSDIRNPFFTAVSRAIEDMAYEHKLSVFLCNTDENPEKEKLYLDLMRDENVAGVILSPTRSAVETFPRVADRPIPIVVIDRRIRDIEVDNVVIDNVESAYKIVAHLISDGHQRIAAMFGNVSTTGQERHEGYLRALKAHGIKVLPELVHYISPREADGRKKTQELLNLPEPPDAIFTGNALLSAGAFRALRERKLAIPEQVAFASFDETTWTNLVEPPVTVIEQPTYEIGQTATDLLLKRIQEPNRPTREIILRGKLIVRESCGCQPSKR
jgi:LacI family fructose operon transcriptional repressor